MKVDIAGELRALVGREVVYMAPDELGRAAIRYFALAIGDHNPLYLDDGFARAHGHAGAIAPPTLVCETNQFVPGPRDEHGYLTQMLAPEIEGTRQIRGGNEYEFMRPVVPEDKITITWRIADVTERASSSGAPMYFVVSEATYTDQIGGVVARNRETIIYQQKDDR